MPLGVFAQNDINGRLSRGALDVRRYVIVFPWRTLCAATITFHRGALDVRRYNLCFYVVLR